MTQNNPSAEPAHRQEADPPVLDYRTPREELKISRGQVIAGMFISALLLVAAVFVGILGSIGVRTPWIGFFIVGVVLAGIIVWAVALKRNLKFRGLAIGLWIGIGAAFLIEGICFGVTNL